MSSSCFRIVSSVCLRKVSAMVPDRGDPIATPLSCWYIRSWKTKSFCLRIVSSSLVIWLVVFVSLYLASSD